jgi:hypothetical protein
MLKQEEILVEEDTGVDINNRHMDRIRDSMLVIIRYVSYPFSSLPFLISFLHLIVVLPLPSKDTCLGATAPRSPWTVLICSNNPKLPLLLPPPLLELHPPKDRMLGLNMPHTGLHTVTMSMILSVSSSPVSLGSS